jgi:hypothetical protein
VPRSREQLLSRALNKATAAGAQQGHAVQGGAEQAGRLMDVTAERCTVLGSEKP